MISAILYGTTYTHLTTPKSKRTAGWTKSNYLELAQFRGGDLDRTNQRNRPCAGPCQCFFSNEHCGHSTRIDTWFCSLECYDGAGYAVPPFVKWG